MGAQRGFEEAQSDFGAGREGRKSSFLSLDTPPPDKSLLRARVPLGVQANEAGLAHLSAQPSLYHVFHHCLCMWTAASLLDGVVG